MKSMHDGFATARLELLCGYPGCFRVPGDGDYICGVDDAFGLPIRLFGDVVYDFDWMIGFNLGVCSFTEEHGLPWNARQSSLEVLSDLPSYFRNRPSRRLELNGEGYSSDGHGWTVWLEGESKGVVVRVDAEEIFDDPQTLPGVCAIGRSGPPPAITPPFCPKAPPLKAGSQSICMRFFAGAQVVECLPGPTGSHLIIFRFSEFSEHAWQPWRTGVSDDQYAALDVQLADWIPGHIEKPLLERRF